MEKVKLELPMSYLELVISYIERTVKSYVPDHDDVDLALRMTVLMKLRIRLLKRQAESSYATVIKLTIPKDESLALCATYYYTSEVGIMTLDTKMALKRITDKAHQQFM